MNWKGCGKKWSWINFRLALKTGIHLEGLKKPQKSKNETSVLSVKVAIVPMLDFEQ
jgi:hypothetical protein